MEKREKRRLERFERLRLSKGGKKEDERLNWSTSGKEKCRKETNDAQLCFTNVIYFSVYNHHSNVVVKLIWINHLHNCPE